MDRESKRHHYLPEFYIKKFCNNEGKIFIHDKDDRREPENIAPKAPKSIFFGWDRNTIVSGGEKTKLIELIYKDIEDRIAPYLNNLKSLEFKTENGSLDVEVLRNLIYLGYLSKWRVPDIDDYLDDLNSSDEDKKLEFFARIKDELYLYESTMKPEFAKEIKRLIYPTLL